LQRNGTGQQWQAILQDAPAAALASLPDLDGIHDVEVTSLHLEEIYVALLAGRETRP
jgi:hypothetical protein